MREKKRLPRKLKKRLKNSGWIHCGRGLEAQLQNSPITFKSSSATIKDITDLITILSK